MDYLWNISKYPMLTLILLIEFFVVATFSVKPIEVSFMFWIATVLLFESFDLHRKKYEKKTSSAN